MSSYFSSFLSRISTTAATSENGGGNTSSVVAAASSKTSSSSSSSTSSSSSFSSFLSPKKMLSQVIAAALQEFFIIENAEEQIRLLDRSNRISLTNLQLRPQVVLSNDVSLLQSKGVVQHVEFSWTWGGNEQTSFIRDITLLVKGVQVTVVNVERTEGDYEHGVEATSSTNSTSLTQKDTKKAESYLERYVQQIIDHLTLKIEDLKVVLEVEDDEKLIVGIQSLCLLTLGKELEENEDSQRILSQRISVDRFAVDIIIQEQTHPLLLPFGYAASVARKSGKRFQDGFLNGLEVQGQVFYDANETATPSTAADGQWTIRLGKRQAQVIGKCMEMLSKYQPSSSSHANEDNQIKEPKEQGHRGVHPKEENSNQSTIMVLPLPSLALVFDNDEEGATRIDLPDCTFTCRLDMSLCQVTGGGTIVINETCPLLQLPSGSEWLLDGVAKSMVVRQPQETSTLNSDDVVVAHLNMEEAPLRRLVTAIMEVAAVVQETTPSLDKEELWKDMEQTVTEEWAAWQDQNATAVFSFALQRRASLRMSAIGANGKEEWLNASLEASSISVKSDGTIQKLLLGAFKAGPTSFGGANLTIPAGTLHPAVADTKAPQFRFADAIIATLDSAQVAESLQDLFLKFGSIISPAEEESLESSSNNPGNLGIVQLPFSIQIPSLRGSMSSPSASFVISPMNVSHTGDLTIDSIKAEMQTGLRLAAVGLQVSVNDGIKGSLQCLRALEIPEVASCQNVKDVSFSFHQSIFRVKLGSIALQLPETQQRATANSQAVNLPFPVHLLADSLGLTIGKTGFDIVTRGINLTATPCGEILQCENLGQLAVDVKHEDGNGSVKLVVGTPHGDPGRLSVDMGTMKIVEMKCESPEISSSSFGKIGATAPSIGFEPDTNAIVFDEELKVSIENEQSVMKMKDCFQPLVDYFTDIESKEPGYGVKLSKALVSTESPVQAHVSLENVVYDGTNTVQVARMQAHENATNASATLSGIAASMEPMSATIAAVEAVHLPGTVSLTDPIIDVQFWYKSCDNNQADELIIVLGSIKLALLQPQPGTGSQVPPPKTAEPIELPCNVKYSIELLSLLDTKFPSAAPTVFRKLFGSVQMPAADPFNPMQELPKMVILKGAFASLQNDMLFLSNGQFHTETRDTSGDAFQNIKFSCKHGMATAGFSSIDWDSMFGRKATNAEPSVIHLPFCSIEALELGLKYRGVMVGTESRIVIPKFVGHAQTTSNDVVEHFKNAILRRSPAFLAKANVLGANLGDSAASAAGMIALAGSSVAGATGASVAGIVAYDGVVAAIRSGKTARGVSEHEKYKFGDITRGSIRAMGSVREGGAGAVSSSASEYAKNNASRLGGAAGSTAGMIAGAALLGPVGLVGGAVMGARAGARAFQSSKNSQTSDTANDNGDKSMPTQQNGTTDLLDDSFGAAAPFAPTPPVDPFAAPVASTPSVDPFAAPVAPTPPVDPFAALVASTPSVDPFAVPVASTPPVDPFAAPSTSQAQQYQQPSVSHLQVQHQHHGYQPQPPGQFQQALASYQQTHRQPQQTVQLQSAASQQQYHTHHSQLRHQNQSIPQQQNQAMQYQAPPQQASYTQRSQQTMMQQPRQQQQYASSTSHQAPPQQQQQQGGYRFGDLTRSVIAKGKAQDGRTSQDGYKFGDFTRGLFK